MLYAPEDERKWWAALEAEMNDNTWVLNNNKLMFVFLPPAGHTQS
jgi:hypothetical protein